MPVEAAAARAMRDLPGDLQQMLEEARALSLAAHGPDLDIFLPGMFVAYGRRGRYPAISLTGKRCAMACGHCNGRLLETMLPAEGPDELLAMGRRLWEAGNVGMLLSGGSDDQGRLPWRAMLPAIQRLRAETGLVLTAHVGRIDAATARALRDAGVSQALVDLVGDPATAAGVLNWPDGLAWQEETLAALTEAGLEVAPHIILGLDHGRMVGEELALEIAAGLNPKRLVFVVLMPMKGTDLAGASPPPAAEVARFLALARRRYPGLRQHLGCARPRGAYRRELDALAVAAGINALAIPSDGALAMAQALERPVTHHDTCCSLG